MNKRCFMGLGLLAAAGQVIGGSVSSLGKASWNQIREGDVSFCWLHTQDGELECELRAPTRGWIAAGFNDQAGIQGTRFVIASVSTPVILVEEHVAIVAGHRSVDALGYKPSLISATGRYADGTSELSFLFRNFIEGRPAMPLSAGTRIYLILAWSHSVDLEHHSAWRKHFSIVL